MTPRQLSALLLQLLQLPSETEWVEFKHNNSNPEMIGEYISALSNSATIHDEEKGYVVWGIQDKTHNILGTTFKPKHEPKGNELLESWLMRSINPQIDIRFYEWDHDAKPIVMLVIPRATRLPIRMKTEAFIRIGSAKQKLKDHPEKERQLWAMFDRRPFESSLAAVDQSMDEVLAELDFTACFELLGLPSPNNRSAAIERLVSEKLVLSRPGERYDITNLGAILFAKNLNAFDRLNRKTIRIIKYHGTGRTKREREWNDAPSQRGYALAFQPALDYIKSQLPQNEPIHEAVRVVERIYPTIAIRELLANALIHQDFNVTGAGPMVELFDDRLEITNPGESLNDPDRLIDLPPRSRNEQLAALMRRMKFCEEAGSGIDKVIEAIEGFRFRSLRLLPPPSFQSIAGSMKTTLYAPKKLTDLNANERIRACYQHCALLYISGTGRMTNASLRKRFGIEGKNASQASRIIRETIDAGQIRPYDDRQGKKYASYIPYWAE